jgi:hypothetical protein
MPRVTSQACARILQWFVLESSGWKTNGAAVLDKALATGGDEVSHGAPFPNMAVKP